MWCCLRCGCPGGRPQTDWSQPTATGNDEVGRLTLRQAGAPDKQCLQRDTTEGRCLEVGSGKNMLDVHVIPRCMMGTRQWSRSETNVCWETTCRHTVTFATKVCCARTLFKAEFLFQLVLNTLPAESMTYNALVVMVCSGERSTRSTQRVTECDTAQTERILTRLVITSRPDSRSVSSHEKRSNTAQHPCNASVPSCVVEPRVTRTPLLLRPHFAHMSSKSLSLTLQGEIQQSTVQYAHCPGLTERLSISLWLRHAISTTILMCLRILRNGPYRVTMQPCVSSNRNGQIGATRSNVSRVGCPNIPSSARS